ncbi:succinate dehydrogenase, cytochrome b556 subunit [Ottowia sp.]|uniref:succinate dehydrogenase, cytochrome b556 subunit n=1 Tax=Ottowia sp. TaxID=1898956 RepID=UPI002BBDDD13|nr:succinate dehydrogenase, cytochrome b556 subunit [Ottowia sp.]HOB66386.1 succinate dehydrogenase, cytochrome b556 subunit [Ottowia sp.]HPZ57361.1 succinate dehydrogenase, cytochrome b556 subunit [Ottowia sp.]HQD49200.1 succinate dehydrogenase, cytochrome b556 subunit [Ottowia sp.]
MSEAAKPRPEFRNINALQDLPTYRWPLAALVSGAHRLSGVLMFLLLPFILWLFDKSVSSEISFGQFTSAFSAGLGIFAGWFVKLIVLALIWAYLHHLLAGIRHLFMDMTHKTTKEFGRQSAAATLVVSLLLTVVLGAKLFGLY